MKYTIFIFLVFCMVAPGCNKVLNLTPKDSLSDATFYKTPEDFKLAANNLYNSLHGFDFGDTESDIAFNTPNDISDGQYLPTENNSTWTNAYYYIRNADNLISKSEGNTDPLVRPYVAEAKFFRAYNYYDLFRFFGGVPLITEPLTVNDPKLYTPRATRKETVDFIIKDLQDAVKSLPASDELADEDVGRITKGAALALIARIALFEGTWQKYRGSQDAESYLKLAVSASTEVMNSGQYALYDAKGSQSYRYLFIEEGNDSKEDILDRRYAVNISGQGYPYSITTGYLVTKKLADMYLCKDGKPIEKSGFFKGYQTVSSEFMDRDPRMTMTMIIPGTATIRAFYPVTPVVNWPTSPQRNGNTGYITYKYLSENVYGNTNNGNNFGFYRHLIRYAEVLLIYAEATYEVNGSISDDDLNKSINLIRVRAGMPALTNSFVTANGLDMKQEIRREREVELALEGFRYDDIRRWKTAETEMTQPVRGIKIKGTAWQTIAPYSEASYQERTDAEGFLIAQPASARSFDPAKDYLRPLPTREIALSNGKLIQNPGWK